MKITLISPYALGYRLGFVEGSLDIGASDIERFLQGKTRLYKIAFHHGVKNGREAYQKEKTDG